MLFRDLISPDQICIDDAARSKTAVLLNVSKLLCKTSPELEVKTLFDAFWKREQMGSTTIGLGILIPHIRTKFTQKIHGCFLKLKNPVDFGAEDKQPVDLVVGLIVAEHLVNEHLTVLSSIIKQFSRPEFQLACRNAHDLTQLCSVLYDPL